MGFVWTKFGVMAPPMEDHRYVYAMNTAGESRKLSKFKYPNHQELKQKCTSLIGLPTVIRTSQNTANWSASEWFSDISLDDEHTGALARTGSDQMTESHADLMLKIKQISQQMESMSNRFEQHVEHQTNVTAEKDQQLAEAENAKLRHEVASLRAQLETEREKKAKEASEAREKRLTKDFDEAIELVKNTNQRNTTLRMENEHLQDKLKEALQKERASLPLVEQKNIDKENQKLLSIKDQIIGHEHLIRIKGHERRTLALRAGVLVSENQRVNLKVIEHSDGNCFIAQLMDYQDCKVVVALGLGKKTGLFAYTFQSTDPIWFEVEEQLTGLSEAVLKNRKDITDEELIAHHNKVKAEIYRRSSEGF